MIITVKNLAKKIKNCARKKAAERVLLITLSMLLVATAFLAGMLPADEKCGALIINSNESVKKYSMIQTVFKTHFDGAVAEIDIGSKLA